MAKNNFDFQKVEEKWMKFWEEKNLYKFNPDTKKPVFSFDTPPPTISGRLHMGHALGDAHQDFFARFKRMSGFEVLNPFGTDNNGLPTLRLVEKEKGVNSKTMKREEFIELCDKTIHEEFIPMFLNDVKRLGMSLDLNLFYSTIDKNSRRISQQSFIDLYKMGREYRIESPALWCPTCQTTTSQVELEDIEFESWFNDIIFKIGDEDLIVSTTRPELLPACVALFVNPKDKRVKNLVGKNAKVPLFDFEVPILEDEGAEMDKGTGIVMCCTFGDQKDMEWQKAHKLEIKQAITGEGKMSDLAGDYKGMKIVDAREKIIQDLKDMKLLVNQKKIVHAVNTCERCKTPIEILSHKQWFVKYLDLKDDLLKWGKKINWHPLHMRTRYDNWIKGLKWDWCISRQIPFGIPFPVWYCADCDEVILADEKSLPVDPLEDKPPVGECPKCGGKKIVPERDIMNTWATSSLTPTIIKELLKDTKVYDSIKDKPLNFRRNGQDIITFWDFNTIVKSQLHNKINPWDDLYINGWMLGRDGKKMSKSLGNGISPQEVIDSHGADLLRYLCASIGPADAVAFSDKELTAGKKFVNKLLNASKFVFMNLKDYKNDKPKKLESLDELFLEKLQSLISSVTEDYNNYKITKANLDVEQFFWKNFCDNYLEIVKKRVYNCKGDEKKSAQYVLYESLLAIVKMIAPIMPFIAEEVYQTYFKEFEKEESIHTSYWPEVKKMQEKSVVKKYEDNELGRDVWNLLLDLISKIRQNKSDAKRSMNSEIILTLDRATRDNLKNVLEDLANVTNAKEIKEGEKFGVDFVEE